MSDKGIGDVYVVIDANTEPFEEGIREVVEQLEEVDEKIEKMDEPVLKELSQSISDSFKEINAVSQVATSSMDAVKLGISGAAVEFDNMSGTIDELSPAMQEFKSHIERLTMSKLDRELTNAEKTFNSLSDEVAELEAYMAKSNDPEWILAIRNQIQALVPELDESLMRIKLIEEQMNSIESSKIKEATSAFELMRNTASKANASITKSFNRQFRSLKRFTVGLIGLRTFWALLTRSMNSYISQNDELNSKIQGVYQGLGQVLAPIANEMVKALQSIIRWLMIAIAYVITFINVMFGTSIAITMSAKNMKALTRNTKAAGKAAQASLAPFDELNILSEETSSSSAITPEVMPDFSPFNIEEYVNPLKEFAEWVEINRSLITGVAIAVGVLTAAWIVFNAVLAVWNILMSPVFLIALGIAAIIAAIVLMVIYWDELKNIAGSALSLIMIGLDALWNVFKYLFDGVVIGFKFMWDMVISVFTAIGTFIQFTISLIIGYFKLYFTVVSFIINAILGIVINIFDNILTVVKFAIDVIKVSFKSIATTASNVWNGVKAAFIIVMNFITSGANKIGTIFKNVWEGIKTSFSSVWNWILRAFSKGGSIFGGVVEGVANVFKTMVNAIIRGTNSIIAVPFKALNGMLNSIRNISILGISPFKNLWGHSPIGIPNIPQLAKGGVVTSSVLANIGEGRYNEAVVPLGNSPQFTNMKQDIADSVIEGLNQVFGNQKDDTEVILMVDGEQFGKVAIKNINKVGRKSGKVLITT